MFSDGSSTAAGHCARNHLSEDLRDHGLKIRSESPVLVFIISLCIFGGGVALSGLSANCVAYISVHRFSK